jgi:hypothetical protein
MSLDFVVLLIAFCGGIFGAAIGGLPSFAFCGLIGLVGVAAGMAGSTFDWHGLVTFGPFFGPQISFVGAVAAAAFARKKGYILTGKEITKGLMGLKDPGVLAVGGIFGALGYIVQTGTAAVFNQGQFDTIAFTVVALALVTKAVFGDGFFGKLSDEARERGRFVPGGSNRWIPYQETMGEKVVIGLGAGGLSAFITGMMLANQAAASNALFVGFLVSAASLLLLQVGVEAPVTHHITLPAAYAVAASGGNILWGVAIAIITSNLGDLGSRVFYIHGETHVDPPAMAIFTGSLLVYLLGVAGVYEVGANILPVLIIAAFVVWALLDSLKSIQPRTAIKRESLEA